MYPTKIIQIKIIFWVEYFVSLLFPCKFNSKYG